MKAGTAMKLLGAEKEYVIPVTEEEREYVLCLAGDIDGYWMTWNEGGRILVGNGYGLNHLVEIIDVDRIQDRWDAVADGLVKKINKAVHGDPDGYKPAGWEGTDGV